MHISDLEITLDHFKKHFGIDMSYNIVFHPFTADKPYEIYNDKHLTVEITAFAAQCSGGWLYFQGKAEAAEYQKGSY